MHVLICANVRDWLRARDDGHVLVHSFPASSIYLQDWVYALFDL